MSRPAAVPANRVPHYGRQVNLDPTLAVRGFSTLLSPSTQVPMGTIATAFEVIVLQKTDCFFGRAVIP
jgi:hypothetical protein